jgi:hypothetical protein
MRGTHLVRRVTTNAKGQAEFARPSLDADPCRTAIRQGRAGQEI